MVQPCSLFTICKTLADGLHLQLTHKYSSEKFFYTFKMRSTFCSFLNLDYFKLRQLDQTFAYDIYQSIYSVAKFTSGLLVSFSPTGSCQQSLILVNAVSSHLFVSGRGEIS